MKNPDEDENFWKAMEYYQKHSTVPSRFILAPNSPAPSWPGVDPKHLTIIKP